MKWVIRSRARGHGRDRTGVQPLLSQSSGRSVRCWVRQPLGGVGVLVEPGEVESLPTQQEVPAPSGLLGGLSHAAVEAAPVDRG
ncbi:hypothetical protein [Streptomyces chartreusis]|uniref:hypothetical protein n=1 Tax=Streptomyces chartreusis TaxID=1969 RepID=UPI003682712B